MIPAGACPRINRLFRFQWEPAQQAHVLLYPEGMVKLNQSAGEILKRCDGSRDLPAIVADLEASFNATGLTPDVEAFLAMAEKVIEANGGIVPEWLTVEAGIRKVEGRLDAVVEKTKKAKDGAESMGKAGAQAGSGAAMGTSK